MLSRRLFVAAAVLLFGLAGAGVSARADDAEDAAKFIQDFGHRAIDSLTDKSLTDKELVERFRNLFREGFDVPYIARSALGRFWPRATDAEKKEYVPLFEDYIVEVYASQFRDYSGEMFKATTAYQAADGVVDVASDVVRSDGPTTKVDWYVAKVDGTFKIQDVKIEGVSMITTHRDTFANEILQHNGQVSGLIEALRSKTALLRSDAGNG